MDSRGLLRRLPDLDLVRVQDTEVASENDAAVLEWAFIQARILLSHNATSWATGNMSVNNPQQTGSDPVTVFDSKHGTVIHSSLNYSFHRPTGEACRGDLTVSVSADGGITWLPPTVVDSGVGCDFSNTQIFNDKEWIVADNNPSSPYYGRTYLTWTKFISMRGQYQSSPIYELHSSDGGRHWTKHGTRTTARFPLTPMARASASTTEP